MEQVCYNRICDVGDQWSIYRIIPRDDEPEPVDEADTADDMVDTPAEVSTDEPAAPVYSSKYSTPQSRGYLVIPIDNSKK
jgi:hypothetical protein